MTFRPTRMQQRYIWLAGSFPSLIVVQGRGYRTPRTKYAIKEDDGELVIFGYSNPIFFLERRGLFREMQAPRTYVLTDAGEREFRKMLIDGAGIELNNEIVEVTVASRRFSS